jgi:hypothetical protein
MNMTEHFFERRLSLVDNPTGEEELQPFVGQTQNGMMKFPIP